MAGSSGAEVVKKDCLETTVKMERDGRHERTRTADLYRVKVAL